MDTLSFVLLAMSALIIVGMSLELRDIKKELARANTR